MTEPDRTQEPVTIAGEPLQLHCGRCGQNWCKPWAMARQLDVVMAMLCPHCGAAAVQLWIRSKPRTSITTSRLKN